ncbi:MAG: sensor histidine kinase [Chloroflexi bacterium]|nr:sensor histidine kinase [Chloroflexota bacterium]
MIHGVAELVEMQMGDEPLSQMLNRASHKLMDEIAAQQQLLAAENGRLELEMADALSQPLLEELVALYTMQATDRGCEVCLSPEAENFLLVTDTAVLGRVLGNMIKNALEACAVGDTVTVGSRSANGRAYFWVHNPTFMRPPVQRQVFLRSFSTKGAQRGLGTYSMRLLSERFLGGRVSFATDPTDGTTFTAVYPLRPDHPAAQMTTPKRETAVAHTIPLSIIFAS